ncbi:MAG: DUF4198 domain-containing protein [Chitinophagaceae bacterium]
MKKILFAASLCVLLCAAFSHEYILIAYKYKVQKGDTLEMHLFVADGFNIEVERPMQTDITKKFELISENGVTDLLAITGNGTMPVVNTPVDFEGPGLVHMERDYARIVLPTDKFLEYLKEDHIENINLKDEPPGKLQRERYSRYIKALVQSGNKHGDTLYKKITGQHFEIILLQDPYLLRVGDLIKVQMLFLGKPLANKMVTARNRTGNKPAVALTSRTDNHGICSFRLSRKGDWFFHTTHMIPCPDKADSDWESFWTSYSFGLE